MLQDLIKNYFLNGFYLTNRSLDIFLVLLLLSLVGFIPSLLGESFIGKVLAYITIPIFFVQFTFWMSIPLFLVDKQLNKQINYHKCAAVVFRNARRLIVPGIILAG